MVLKLHLFLIVVRVCIHQVRLMNFKNILNNPSKIEEMIYMYPPSRIKNNGVAINNYDFLTRTNNKDCLDALIKITESINMKEIYTIVNETPYISDYNKEFFADYAFK